MQTKKNSFWILVFTLFNILLNAQVTNYAVITSTVSFKIKNAKVMVTGNFRGIDAKINFNTGNLEKSKIQASITANSIETGIQMRDNHLKKSEYFDVETFPTIGLLLKNIILIGENKYKASCALTLKGKTKDVEMPFTFIEKNNMAEFNGVLNVNRLDFGVGSSSVIMSRDVIIKLVVIAKKT